MEYVVRVDLSPHQVTFRMGDYHLALPPILYASYRSDRLGRWLRGPVKLHGIGSPPAATSGFQEVRLFEPHSRLPEGVSKEDCLEMFFRYALATLVNKFVFRIKPEVRLYGGIQLDPVFAGYQEGVLRAALLKAGAARVVYHP